MQEDWEGHGKEALKIYREKFSDRYVENYTMLARVIWLEADVKHSMAKPKTVDEALAYLENRVGKEGRRKFEKFLREVGGGSPDLLQPFPKRPRGMHQGTYMRLRARDLLLLKASVGALHKRLSR